MENPESANVGVVIGFIVTAIVLAIGVVSELIYINLAINPVPGADSHPLDPEQLYLVYHPELPCNNHPEWLRTPCHRPHRKVVLTPVKRFGSNGYIESSKKLTKMLESGFAARTGGRWNFRCPVYVGR